MKNRRWYWALCFALGLSGCGKSASEVIAPRTSPSYAESSSSSSPSPRGMELPPAPQAAPPSSRAARDVAEAEGRSASSSAPAPRRERPGLGTEWGETRSSPISDVSFNREGSRPFENITLHYNDRDGVLSLAGYHDKSRSRSHPYDVGSPWVRAEVVDDSGEPFETFRAGDRNYVIGEHGARYSVVLTNLTAHRLEAVMTVDGLDVISGERGNLQNRGYLLMPYAQLTIDGFRQSREAVAAFRFGRVADSYAAKTGSARNVGVIGVALFAEKGDSPRRPDYEERDLRLRDTANPFPDNGRFAKPPR